MAEPDDLGGEDGAAIAGRLFAVLDSDRLEVGVAELWHYGATIEMELVDGNYWAIECIGPDAFHFYPGIVRDDGVIWANVWVAPDLTFEEMTERLAEVAAKAKRKTE